MIDRTFDPARMREGAEVERTRQAMHASIERDDDRADRLHGEYVATLERDYRALVAERDYWRYLYAYEQEDHLSARKAVRRWRTAGLLALGMTVLLWGGQGQRGGLVAAGVVLVCLGILSGHTEV